ncbi:MAG: hypothetical protein MJ123_01035 [Lachnospiraceae bacterium]|nr:hypothetical protein [Lachnospiraceae bacterium]
MNVDDVLRAVLKKIKKSELLEGKSIVIFGVNNYLPIILNDLYKYSIIGIFDNSVSKQGKYWDYKVIAPTAENIDVDNTVVLIASKYYEQMKEQLLSLGYKMKNIIQLLNFIYVNWLVYDFNTSTTRYYLGKSIYDKYKDENKILLFPSKSLGDAYLPLRYMNIDNYVDYKVLVCSGVIKRMLSAVGFYNVDVLAEDEILCLQRYYALHRAEIENICYVHPVLRDGRLIDIDLEVMVSKEHAFWEYYGDVVLNNHIFLPSKEEISFNADKKRVEKLFSDLSLIPNKTVVLAPYAKSLREFPICFWVKLSEELKKRGYSVCTNISGDEAPIEGTIPLNCKIEDFKEIMKMAGNAVFIRCGLCDIISDINVKKVAIYRERPFPYGLCSFFEINDMRKGHVDDDVVQLLFDEECYENTINEILTNF